MEFRPSRLLGTLPLPLSLALGCFVAFPQVRANPVLFETFLGTAGLLASWWAVLTVRMASQHRTPAFAVALLKQHYLQASVHTSILLYWGWYVQSVYAEGYLILAQLVFVYVFDMLLQLTRRGRYSLGFGPFPIVLSTNLFLWFLNDWFYFQFAMIAAGFAAKEFLHWNRGGKSVHIFNPSSFPLAIVSWVLLFTNGFGITWGAHIAGSQFRPPNIYLFIFLVSLPGQYLFGVVTMTISAVVTMYVWAAAYTAMTGTPMFQQAYIPIAVFLAMNLLFTDPATSPRSELARILYGIAYAGTVILMEVILLEVSHLPEAFAAKLLLVPVLNLAVPLFERVGQWRGLKWIDPARIAPWLSGRRRNLAYMALWASAFAVMLSLRGIGDRFPGQETPFWRQACNQHGGRSACEGLRVMESLDCRRASGWACNEQGVSEQWRGMAEAQASFSRACSLGFSPGCANLNQMGHAGAMQQSAPRLVDYPILMSTYKWTRQPRLSALPPEQLLAEACSIGWTEACGARPSGGASP